MPDPTPEFLVGPERLRVDAKPTVHLPATHLEALYVRRRDESLGLGRIDAQQQPTLTAGTDGHVAVDEKGETAKHLPLRETGFTLKNLSDPVSKFVVVSHGRSIPGRGPETRCRLVGMEIEIPAA